MAAGAVGAFKVEEAGFFEINDDGLGEAAEQAGGEGGEMGVVADDEDGFAGAGEAEGHGAGIVFGEEAGGFETGGVELEVFADELGGLGGADEGAVPDLADVEGDIAFEEEGGELLELLLAFGGKPPVGVGFARFGIRMT